MKLLYKLLKQNVSVLQLAVFMAVNLLGGVILLLGVKAYSDFNAITNRGDDILSSSSIVINKALPASATINSILGKNPTFSDDEIAELEALPSVASVGGFVAARFEVGAVLSIASARLSTDIFLEAVPDEFVIGNYAPVDAIYNKWSARIFGDTVPVIIPRNYLNLYNFGYAASNNLPQVSDDMIGYLPLKLIFETKDGDIVYDAVICGLTDKFNTILVPWEFLNEANAAYAPGATDKYSRLILTTNATEFDEAAFSLLDEKRYVVEGDAAPLRLQNVMFVLIYIIIGVGGLFSVLAFILFVISILLLIEKNREKIANLYSIGYSVGEISRVYRCMALIVNVFVWLLAAVAATIIYPLIADVLQMFSSSFRHESDVMFWFFSICLAVVFVVIHSFIIFVNIKKFCK